MAPNPSSPAATSAATRTAEFAFGSIDQIVEQLLALRERHGISYLTVIQPQMEAFAPVVARLEGR